MMQSVPATLAVVGVSFPFRGGIAHYSTLLVRSLRLRHHVEFITFRRQYPGLLFPGKTQYDESANPIREDNQALIDSTNPATWMRTARTLNHMRPQFIVFNWWHPFFGMAYGSIVQLLDPALRRKVCFLCHNVRPHEAHLLEQLLCRYAFRHVQYFIVHSEEDKQKLLRLKPSAHALRNGHPVFRQFSDERALSKAAARTRLGLPPERSLILFFGLIRPYKGLGMLIEAMPQILGKVDCTLLVAGEFYDDKSKYTALIDRHNLTNHVRLEDKYISNEKVAVYFAAADVVVLPYLEASQSGIVPIAYSFNTPVISTRVGGLPEAVIDGETGLLVDPGSPEQLADAVVRYYQNGYEPKFRDGIRERASRFDCEEEIRNIEHFLKQANVDVGG
jgi:glycosyltransferase involved in cell wall biosynthesis